MKHPFYKLGIVVFLLVALTFQYGCRENVLINSKISPANNEVGVFSAALPCITHTYYSDSAITSTNIGGIPVYQGIGSITDPFFGSMTGATFFQIVPVTPSSDTFSGNTIDSAVLVLPYSGFTYGDTTLGTGGNITQSYQVFYMTDSLSSSVTYYSNSNKPVDNAYPLSEPVTVNIYHLKDSLGTNTLDINHPGLRIKLNLPVLKNHLFPAIQNISSSSTNPSKDFISLFNGLCVRVADSRKTANAFPYFQLDGSTTYSKAGILVYYHTTGTTTDSSFSSAFSFNTAYCSHFNSITRSYSRYPVNQLLQSTKPADDVIALQNEPGPSIDVMVTGINSIPKDVVINKAELRLTLLPKYQSDVFFAPERLYPVGVANATYPPNFGAGTLYNVADRYPTYSTSPLTVMDGFLHSLTSNSITLPTFTINLPREVMYSLAQKNDTVHFKVTGTQDFYGAFHMVAGGGNYGASGTSDTLYRAKLIVTYSKLSN